MNKDRLIEFSLIGVIICGLTYAIFDHEFSNIFHNIKGALVDGGNDTTPESLLESKTKEKADGGKISIPSLKIPFITKRQHAKPRDISEHVLRQSKSEAPLPYIVYQFQAPLLPQARLLDFRFFDDKFWFSGNTGLVGFDLSSEQWFVYDKHNGLPGDTAYDIEVADGELFIEAYNWKVKNERRSLTGIGSYRFSNGKFNKFVGSIDTAEAGFKISSKLTGLQGAINDVIHHDDHVWASMRGKLVSREEGFRDGGVAKITNNGVLANTYTLTDGIADSYAFTMNVMQDNSLWLSHFKEERGLSVLRSGTTRWEMVKKSTNGINLGGVRLGSIKHILIIGQQRGLVFYDTHSGKAYLVKESMGLPGYIVSGIQTVRDTVWVSAYSYAKDGQRSTGLIQFEYHDIEALFL